MFKKYLYILLLLLSKRNFAQKSSTDPEFEAQAIGGKAQIEQALQTQLNLPKLLVNSDFKTEVLTFFDLDSAGNAIHIKIEGQVNNVLRQEVSRMFRFLKFKRTLHLPNESRPYFLNFSLSTEKYNKYIKQHSKFNLKNPKPADSSFVVHAKADRSPVYYKNGEEGLVDYILSEIEYPKIAIEKSIEGTVVLEFIVEINGYVTGIEVKKSVNGGCTEEAIRLIRETKWNPAVLNDKLVRYKTTYPITFSLRNVNKGNESSSQTIGQ